MPSITAARPRAAGVLVVALALALASHGVAVWRSTGDPNPPSAAIAGPTPGRVEPPGGGPGGSLAQIDRSIRAWSKNLEVNDRDFLAATNLGVLYHGRGRLTADVGDYGRALAAAARALAIEPGHAPARALDAAIRYTIHDFTGALAGAEALLRDDPDHLGALATLADAELELGRLDDARAHYARLAAAAPGPAVDIRLARLAYVTGDRARALELATAASATATDETAFYATARGEYARLAGDPAGARAAFVAALATHPDDLAALVGLARIDAFEGRTGPAIARLRHAAAIAPQPETLALLGDLLVRSGDDADAGLQFDTVRLTATLSDLAGAVYDRQLILFELDHGGEPGDLLDRARSALRERADQFGHDMVAWAAYRAGDVATAVDESRLARAGGLRDARVLYHAAVITIAAGDRVEGARLVAEALALGPALDPAERAAAAALRP